MSKVVVLAAAAGAYVLGAKAGRERFEQIRTQAQPIWRSPRVQKTTSRAAGLVKDKAPVAAAQITDAAREVVDKVKPNGIDASDRAPSRAATGDAAARVEKPAMHR